LDRIALSHGPRRVGRFGVKSQGQKNGSGFPWL
jgi:hypothetical protein